MTSIESAAPLAPAKQYVCSFDIERAGKQFKWSTFAVGVCFGTLNGTMLKKEIFACPITPEVDFEPRCWHTFWIKYPEVLAEIAKYTTTNHLRKLHDWLVNLEREYGPFGRKHEDTVKFRWCSDNPQYDGGALSREFGALGYDTLLSEMFDDYVSTDDPTEQEAALTKKQQALVESLLTSPHDHNPHNDAAQIFQRLCAVKLVLACTRVTVNDDGDEVVHIDMEHFQRGRANFVDIPLQTQPTVSGR